MPCDSCCVPNHDAVAVRGCRVPRQTCFPSPNTSTIGSVKHSTGPDSWPQPPNGSRSQRPKWSGWRKLSPNHDLLYKNVMPRAEHAKVSGSPKWSQPCQDALLRFHLGRCYRFEPCAIKLLAFASPCYPLGCEESLHVNLATGRQ